MKRISLMVSLVVLLSMFVNAQNFVKSFKTFPENQEISLRSVNFPDHLIRHQGYIGKITKINSALDKKDASFKVVASLVGDNASVSFESVNFPGYYLRHQGFVLKLMKRDGSPLFNKDASFKPVAGLSGQGYSFESVNYPQHYLRHENFQMKLARFNNDKVYKECATFLPDIAAITNLSGKFRLKSQFRGNGECLEGNQAASSVHGGGAFMDKQQNVSGQMWNFEPVGNQGYYRLKNLFRGNGECLESNQGASTHHGGAAFMDRQQNVSGQMWRFEPAGNGYFRLKSMFRGDGECLESNQGASKVHGGCAFMDKEQNVSGQLWKLEPIK